MSQILFILILLFLYIIHIYQYIILTIACIRGLTLKGRGDNSHENHNCWFWSFPKRKNYYQQPRNQSSGAIKEKQKVSKRQFKLQYDLDLSRVYIIVVIYIYIKWFGWNLLFAEIYWFHTIILYLLNTNVI